MSLADELHEAEPKRSFALTYADCIAIYVALQMYQESIIEQQTHPDYDGDVLDVQQHLTELIERFRT